MRTVGSFAVFKGCGGWRFLFSELPEFVGDLDAGRLVLPGFGGFALPLVDQSGIHVSVSRPRPLVIRLAYA